METTFPIDGSNQDESSITIGSIDSSEISLVQSCSPHISLHDSSNLEMSISNETDEKAEPTVQNNTRHLQKIEKLNNSHNQIQENIQATIPDSSSQNIDVSSKTSTSSNVVAKPGALLNETNNDEIIQLNQAGQENEAKADLVKNMPEPAVISSSNSQEQPTCSVKVRNSH